MPAIAIKNARVFDGRGAADVRTVVIEEGLISAGACAGTVIDAAGCTLLPGLIDAHVHLYENTKYLEMCAGSGVTTMLDMGIRNPKAVDTYRSIPGLTSVLSSCGLIFAPGSKASKLMNYPESMGVKSVRDAARIVGEHVEYGADYIKLILEEKGRNKGVDFPPDIGRAVVEEAHKRGKKVVAHAVTNKTFQNGVDLGVDVLTHIPFTEPLAPGLAEAIVKKGIVVVPTLIMGKCLIDKIRKAHPHIVKIKSALDRSKKGKDAFDFTLGLAQSSVAALKNAGVNIFVGTDSNMDDPTTPASVPFGKALHDELGLFVALGFTPAEALRSATAAPAEYFGFSDRGRIQPGLRADLLLVRGNPAENIQDIRNVERVWIKGVEVKL